MTVGWHFVVFDTADGAIGELTAATSRELNFYLNDAATAKFNIAGTHSQALMISETETDLVVYRDVPGADRVARFRGRFGPSGDKIDDTGHACTFSAVDYRGFLTTHRFIWPGSTTVFVAEEQSDIAWQLIEDTQALAGGDLGITRASAAPTGITPSPTYAEGVSIGDTIKSLADLDTGFDWEIDAQRRFQLYYPKRGETKGIILEYGGNVAKVDRQVGTDTFATAVRYSGGSSLTAATAEALSFGAAGRWELQVGDTSILDQPTLDAKAAFELDKDIEIDPSYALTMRQGTWTPDALWLGDFARVIIRKGRLNVDALQRVSQITVTLDDDGGETVVITTGPVLLSAARRLQFANQRISALSRR